MERRAKAESTVREYVREQKRALGLLGRATCVRQSDAWGSAAEALADADVVGRPHMARVMVSNGIVRSIQEAFDHYLAKWAPAYVDRFRLDPPDAVRLLREAGDADHLREARTLMS